MNEFPKMKDRFQRYSLVFRTGKFSPFAIFLVHHHQGGTSSVTRADLAPSSSWNQVREQGVLSPVTQANQTKWHTRNNPRKTGGPSSAYVRLNFQQIVLLQQRSLTMIFATEVSSSSSQLTTPQGE